jgi:hypothetical protein
MKKVLLALAGVVVLLVIIGFLLPGEVEVTRSMTIQSTPSALYNQVNTLKNWERWSYWHSLDRAMKITYSDQPSGAGAWYSWESEDMGKGKMTITSTVPDRQVKADLEFMEENPALCWYDFEPAGNGTTVTIGFRSNFGMNPIMRWLGVLIFKSEMNKAFDYNLTRLKELTEGK